MAGKHGAISHVTVRLGADVVSLVRHHAKLAEIGGRSNFRREERGSYLKIDQFIGMLGTAAGSIHLFGGTGPFERAREKANLNPTQGDGGEDFIGLPLDIKTSLLRYSPDPLRYTLPVRPGELRKYVDGQLIVLAMAEPSERDRPSDWAKDNAWLVARDEWLVHIVGWATRGDLPPPPDVPHRVFGDAHCIAAADLRPLSSLVVPRPDGAVAEAPRAASPPPAARGVGRVTTGPFRQIVRVVRTRDAA
jgi:hypothetical protein